MNHTLKKAIRFVIVKIVKLILRPTIIGKIAQIVMTVKLMKVTNAGLAAALVLMIHL